MTRFFAISVLAFALTGCGTVRNFTDESAGTPKPYGGVKIAIDRFKGESREPLTWLIPEELSPLFWPIDVPLCAVGDTIALPVTVPLAFIGALHHHYFPNGMTPEQIPNWLQDSQPNTLAPLTVPAAPEQSPNEVGVTQ